MKIEIFLLKNHAKFVPFLARVSGFLSQSVPPEHNQFKKINFGEKVLHVRTWMKKKNQTHTCNMKVLAQISQTNNYSNWSVLLQTYTDKKTDHELFASSEFDFYKK